jgi:hypothetical protein
MGWSYGYGSTRMDEANQATAGFDHKDSQGNVTGRTELIKRTFVGNTLYSLHRVTRLDGTPDMVFAAVTLLQRSSDGWGHKCMDESMGPCFYDMPVGWLDELTEPMNDYARAWREKVRETHENRPQAGEERILNSRGVRVIVEKVNRTKAIVREIETGQRWRARIASLVKIEPPQLATRSA